MVNLVVQRACWCLWGFLDYIFRMDPKQLAFKYEALRLSAARRQTGHRATVLSLYRRFLRVVKTKVPSSRLQMRNVIRQNFEANRSIPMYDHSTNFFLTYFRTDVEQIEFCLSQAERQLKQLKSPHVSSLSSIQLSKTE